MDKSSDAFRTISEVAGDLDLPQHVLRFWETRFAQIKPLKRGGGRRYYRPDDVELLKGIRHLLYGEGYTIKGVQRILKDQGVRFVMALWQEGAAAGLDVVAGAGPANEHDAFDARSDQPRYEAFEADDEDDYAGVDPASDPIDLPATPLKLTRGDDPRRNAQSPLDRAREASYTATRTVSMSPVSPQRTSGAREPDEGFSPESIAQRFAPRAPDASTGGRPSDALVPTTQVRGRPDPANHDAGPAEWSPQTRQPPFSPMIDRFRGVASRLAPDSSPRALSQPIGTGGGSDQPAAGHGLSRDDVRRLQATLFELLECKRLLDQTR